MAQSPYVDRVVGSIRRECLDHVIVLDEAHLRRILREYVDYYHTCRTHLSLEKDAPDSRPVELPAMDEVVSHPKVGGLSWHAFRAGGPPGEEKPRSPHIAGQSAFVELYQEPRR